MSQAHASETWGTAMGASSPSTGGQMIDTVKGWMTQWWFWVIVGLAVLSLILLIWAISATVKKNNLKKAQDESGKTEDQASSYRRRRRANYMPDPGIPAKRMLHDRGAASGYTAGMSQDPDVILKQAIRQ